MKSRTAGFILIYVVALTAALSLILFQLQQRSAIPRQTERQLARALQAEESDLLLDFVIAAFHERALPADSRYLSFRRLLAQDPARISELEDALSQLRDMLNQFGFKIPGRGADIGMASRLDNEGNPFPPRKTAYQIKLGDHAYDITIRPSNALPNLDTLPLASLAGYLRHLGLAEAEARQLAADLIDWRDVDDFSTEQIGAEFPYYLALATPYRPRNAPFRHWQELAYVRGVSPDRLQKLRDNFSLGGAGQAPGVYIEYASAPSIAALSGLKLEMAEALLQTVGKNGREAAAAQQTAFAARTDEIAAFDAVLSWKPETDRVRIEITGSEASLTADYDVKEKRVLGRW